MNAAPAFLGLRQIQIRIESGDLKGHTFLLDKSPLYIGREAGNDVVVAQDTKMSRRHLEVIFDGSKWWVKNLSTKNVLRVNGQEVTEHEIVGSVKIEIGESELIFSVPESSNPVVSQRRPQANLIRPLVSSGGAPPPPGMVRPQVAPSRPPSPKSKSSNKMLYIAIFSALIGAAIFLSESGPLRSRRTSPIKTQDQVILNLQKSEDTIREIEAKQEQSGRNGLQYQLAQEQFLKGFRDYRQGQYALAMTSFSAATSLYPNHELAKKYYYLSKRKFDEKVQIYMIQGKRYLGKNNFRLCRSSYESVMVMVRNESDPIYKEAKQFSAECAKKAEGKY